MSQQALGAIRDCVGRDPKWIHAYAEEYLDLAALPVLERDPDPPAPGPEEDSRNQSSVFPDLDPQQTAAGELPPETTAISPEQPAPPQTKAKPPVRKPSSPKEPSELDRLESFLASRGFEWDESQGIFIHPDGPVVRRSEGLFPWELATAAQTNPLWLAASAFSDKNGIEVPAEVWSAAKRCDAVLLEPQGDSCREHHFSAIRAEVDSQDLELYPATYRLRMAKE